MKPTLSHLQHACRITLLTRSTCSLCVDARRILAQLWERRPFEYREIDIMTRGGKVWRDVYEFDTPVVSGKWDARVELTEVDGMEQIHVERLPGAAQVESILKSPKVMHRFTVQEVEKLMDDAEQA